MSFKDRDHPIEEYMAFQHRTWLLERLAWALMAVVLALGLAGLLGEGPASEAVASSPDGLRIEYQRLQRITRLTRFTLTLPHGGGEAVLRLGAPFAERYEISDVSPRPIRSSANAGGLELTFAAPRSGAFKVVIWVHPRRAGFMRLAASQGDAKPATMSILVYP